MFKKLKSLFIVEEEESGKKSTTGGKKAVPAKSSPKGASAPKAASGYDKNNPPKGKPMEKFVNRLMGALEEHNSPVFDYLEYKQAVQNLGNVDMDESTRFKSALAMAKSMGATPENLVKSANQYLKVLAKEEAKFLEAFKNQQAKQVTNQGKQIKQIEQGIAQRKAQIEKLKKEIESGTKTLEEKKGSINSANAKVEATKAGFYSAYHIVTSQISSDIEKMKQHLT